METTQNETGMRRLQVAAERLARRDGHGNPASILASAVSEIPEKDHISEAEFLALVDVNNGSWMMELNLGDIMIGDQRVWDMGMLDDPELGPKWGIDIKQLAERLGRWSPIQRLALLAAIDDWWRANSQ